MASATAAASPPPTLLEQARSGDRHAFGRLLRHHDGCMRALAWRLLGDRDRMDDVLQEAYLKAWVVLPGFCLDADFGTWLYRIAYNACIDELCRAARRPTPCDWSAPGEHPIAQAAGPERQAVAADATARVLASLPEDQRAAVVLVYGEGFDNHPKRRAIRSNDAARLWESCAAAPCAQPAACATAVADS